MPDTGDQHDTIRGIHIDLPEVVHQIAISTKDSHEVIDIRSGIQQVKVSRDDGQVGSEALTNRDRPPTLRDIMTLARTILHDEEGVLLL